MQQTRALAICGGLMGLAMLCYPLFANRASAAVVYSQNFDSLNLGNLEGQNSWIRNAGTADMYQVVNSYFHSSPNSFRFSGTGSNNIYRTFTSINENAYLTVWFKMNTATTTYAFTGVLNSALSNPKTWTILENIINAPGGGVSCYLMSGPLTNGPYVNDGNWYQLKMEYRDSDGAMRFGIANATCSNDSGYTLTEFTNWVINAPVLTDIGAVFFNGGNGQYVYFDDLVIGTGSAPPEVPQPLYSINITYPVNGTTTADFNHWGLDYIFFTNTTTKTLFDILVNTSPTATSTQNWYQDHIIIRDFIPDSTTTHSIILNKQFAFPSQRTWYSKAYLLQGATGDIFAFSGQISYTISTSTAGIWEQPPTSTSTSAEFVMTCDPTDPLFERSLCKLAVWLLAPKYSDFDVFTDIKNVLQTKPPFGYLTAALTAFGGLTATTTPEVDLPVVPGLGSEVKSVIGIILWVLALLHIFNRLRYFEL